jgi:protein O-mannosyl-transferase
LSSSSATAAALEKPQSSGKPPGVFVCHEKRSTILCLLLVLVVLSFYNPVVHNQFTNLDDKAYIVDNTHVRAGLTWGTVKWAFTSRDAANWHPLTWLSHALDYQLFKLNPVGTHYVNVLFHAANAVLLFLLLEIATGVTWPSLMVAALFALHPINVESVAWAAERKNVLSMFFFLLTLHAYQRYVRKSSAGRYALVALLFALGLMAKPEIITLPFVLLLWDYWPLQRLGRRSSDGKGAVDVEPRAFSFLVLEKVPLLLLSAGSAVITLIAQQGGQAIRPESNWVRVGNALVAYVRYLGKAFWPSRLAPLYPHSGQLLPTWQIIASATLLLLLTALVLQLRCHRYLAVGWFWFLGTLVPVIGLVQVGVQAMADRYAYLSFIGLFICVVWAVAERLHERKIAPAWPAVPAILVLATCGMLTHRQIACWHDSVTLWKYTLSVTDKNYFAQNALADVLAQDGQVDEAIARFDAAERMHAYTARYAAAIAAYKQTHGHLREAVDEYNRALDVADDSKTRSIVLSRLVLIYLQIGDLNRSRLSCSQALKENPENGAALVGCGLLAEREGDLESAASQIFQAMKVEPTDVGYLLLAQALRREGKVAEAENAQAQAQRISPDISQARQSAAQILDTDGIQSN